MKPVPGQFVLLADGECCPVSGTIDKWFLKTKAGQVDHLEFEPETLCHLFNTKLTINKVLTIDADLVKLRESILKDIQS